MKRPLHNIFTIFVFMFLVNIPQSFATTVWQSNSVNGGGEWSEASTWLSMPGDNPGIPQPGDIIIINGADVVTITATVDLTSIHDDSPTSIIVNGILLFTTPGGNCDGGACDIDLILDTDSEIVVNSDADPPDNKGIRSLGPGIGQRDIIIGGVSVLPTTEWPFGPGILPQDAPLPVHLVSFTGIALESSNMLKWQTESEENTKEFVLERSTTGRDDFMEIGFIGANGFSESVQTYNFEDKKPLSMAYYRLKMVDFDGSFEYSEIIAIEKLHVGVTEFEIYPVPIKNEVNVRVNSKKMSNATLTLTNYLGQVILVEKLDLNIGVNEFMFNWDNVDSGLHFIIIENDQERLVKKVF